MAQPSSYPAPDFNLKDVNGKFVKLDDFSGKWLVLYFYPKDDTPGCTIEACSLRDVRDDLTDLGAVVVGISRDDSKSHDLFKTKYNLNFNLLSDPDHIVMEKYGAWGKKAFGQEGILRKTFIINPDGMVVKVYGKVTPLGHGYAIVNDLKTLQK
jgi:peroxiredoxin Q/BCP